MYLADTSELGGARGHLTAPSLDWVAAERPTLLTFDDGPSETVTPLVLRTLAKFGIRAAFFVIGKNLETPACRRLVEQMVETNHLVGNHSFTHADLTKLSASGVLEEIDRTRTILETLGVRERIFRPPYGRFDGKVAGVAKQLNYWGLGWNVDTNDWKLEHQDGSWTARALTTAATRRENVVLMHDVHTSTALHLKRFIERLLDDGRSFPRLFCQPEHGSGDQKAWSRATNGTQMMASIQLYRP